MAGDGSVSFSIELDDRDAEKELNRFAKKIRDLEFDINVKETTKKRLQEQLSDIDLKFQGVEDVSAVEALSKEYAAVEAKIRKIDEAISENRDVISAAKEEAAKYADQVARVKQEAAEAAAREEQEAAAERRAAEAAERKAQTQARFKSVAGGLLKTVTGIAGTAAQAVGNIAAKIPGVVKGIAGAISKMNVFKRVSEKIGPVFSKLGGMIKRVFVFSVLTAGLRPVRAAMSSFLSQNAELSASLERVKAALTTAFMPIYNMVVPALQTLLNALTSVLAAVARFTAMLGGTTAKAAQSNAKALTAQANATEEAGGAAEEASKQLASFDEIQKLNTEDAGGGGGGAEAEAEVPGFDIDFEEETEEAKTWGEAFSGVLDGLLEKVQQLPEVFSGVAEKINGFFGNLLEMFTFPGVEEKVIQLGHDLAEALNGLVDEIDWETIGAALGAGLNLAIQFLVSFIYTFDWQNLGAKLAEAFNALIEKIDWYAFGQLLWAGFKIAIETLAGFLLNLDMKKLAESASNIVKGFFDSMTETITSINWQELGHQVKEFLVNVDWAGIAESVFTAIGAAFGAAAAFLWGLIKDAWKKVVDWWYDVAYEDGEFTLKGLLEGIWNVIKSIGTWIYEHIFQPFINGFKKAFGIASPSTEMETMGDFVMEGLLNGVKSKITAVVDTFTGLWQSIKEVFSNISGWFEDKFSAAWQAVKDVFSKGGEIFSGIKEGILDGLKAVVNALIDGINKVISVPFNGLNAALNSIKNVDILGLKPFSWIQEISVPQIPRLAAGAVIPPNREFLAVLGDQRSGNNIEAPEAALQAMANQAASANAAYLERIIALLQEGKVMMIGSETFARLVYNTNRSETARHGGTLVNVSGRL